MDADTTSIDNHSGRKYLRTIHGAASAQQPGRPGVAIVDVYAVLEAYAVTCPAIAHAIKKLLAAGLRDKGDAVKDVKEARDAVSRAIELAEFRASLATPPGAPPVSPGPTGPAHPLPPPRRLD